MGWTCPGVGTGPCDTSTLHKLGGDTCDPLKDLLGQPIPKENEGPCGCRGWQLPPPRHELQLLFTIVQETPFGPTGLWSESLTSTAERCLVLSVKCSCACVRGRAMHCRLLSVRVYVRPLSAHSAPSYKCHEGEWLRNADDSAQTQTLSRTGMLGSEDTGLNAVVVTGQKSSFL